MSQQDARFSGKVAFITGASDSGIGGAIAERLASEGARVCLAGVVRPNKLIRRLQRMQAQPFYVECDVTDDRAVQQAVQACVQELQGLDVVINNAGIEILHPLASFPADEADRMLDVNLNGAIRVARAALPYLDRGAAIVSIASALALGGCSSFSVYSASKAGLIGLTQSLAMELAPREIRVVAVAPALVASPMTFRHLKNLTPEGKKKLEAAHPLGTGTTHDVASAVAFLASSDARFITGATLPVGFISQFALPTDHFPQSAATAEVVGPTLARAA